MLMLAMGVIIIIINIWYMHTDLSLSLSLSLPLSFFGRGDSAAADLAIWDWFLETHRSPSQPNSH